MSSLTPSRHFPLLALPLEIRHQIYREILASEPTCVYLDNNEPGLVTAQQHYPDWAIIRTCWQVKTEIAFMLREPLEFKVIVQLRPVAPDVGWNLRDQRMKELQKRIKQYPRVQMEINVDWSKFMEGVTVPRARFILLNILRYFMGRPVDPWDVSMSEPRQQFRIVYHSKPGQGPYSKYTPGHLEVWGGLHLHDDDRLIMVDVERRISSAVQR